MIWWYETPEQRLHACLAVCWQLLKGTCCTLCTTVQHLFVNAESDSDRSAYSYKLIHFGPQLARQQAMDLTWIDPPSLTLTARIVDNDSPKPCPPQISSLFRSISPNPDGHLTFLVCRADRGKKRKPPCPQEQQRSHTRTAQHPNAALKSFCRDGVSVYFAMLNMLEIRYYVACLPQPLIPVDLQ